MGGLSNTDQGCGLKIDENTTHENIPNLLTEKQIANNKYYNNVFSLCERHHSHKYHGQGIQKGEADQKIGVFSFGCSTGGIEVEGPYASKTSEASGITQERFRFVAIQTSALSGSSVDIETGVHDTLCVSGPGSAYPASPTRGSHHQDHRHHDQGEPHLD